MSLFSPRTYQSAYRPYRTDEDSLALKVFTSFEKATKGLLFGCRMCGNCILRETAFVCPMTCPKGMRNGLCGGATPEACEVDPSRPCTWYVIYERAERMGREETLLEINAPMDGDKVGRATWLEVAKNWRASEQRPSAVDFVVNREKFSNEWDQFFYDLRQPDWWQGDSEFHPAQYKDPISHLEASLRSGVFTTVTEIAPPLGATTAIIEKKVGWIKDYVSAANFTDNASAVARMSSIACSRLCLDLGIEPIVQMQARDRTRVVIESDAMGVAGLGLKNLLVVTGDHHRFGLSPRSTPIQFDMDSIQVLWMLRRMRDEGVYLDGRPIKNRPEWFLGAAASPYGAIPKYEALRFEKKINAGAQFIQTQPVFDYNRYVEWLEALDKRNLLGKAYILAGLVPLKSARAAHFMDENVPGVVIPPDIIKRMDEAADKEGQQEVGAEIALELIEKVKETSGISGLHIMAVHWEQIVHRLVEESGLPRPSAKAGEKEGEARPVEVEASGN